MPGQQPMLDSIDPEVVDRLVSRRDALRRGAAASGGLMTALAIGSVPIALASLTRQTFAQAPTTIRGVLEFAYLLENLEAEFYLAALGTGSSATVNGLFAPVRATLTAAERSTFALIAQHEVAHVALLRTAIQGLGGTPATFTPASFDFTGGNGSLTGPFLAATSDKGVLLAAAQAFEDTGVRAYKGQAANLMTDNALLETALRIHSVEARHAARIRRMRAAAGAGVNFSGTITLGASGISGLSPAGTEAIARIYGGATPENNVTQAGLDVTGLAANFGGAEGASEAFDEPLTYDEVVAIVAPFVVGDMP